MPYERTVFVGRLLRRRRRRTLEAVRAWAGTATAAAMARAWPGRVARDSAFAATRSMFNQSESEKKERERKIEGGKKAKGAVVSE